MEFTAIDSFGWTEDPEEPIAIYKYISEDDANGNSYYLWQTSEDATEWGTVPDSDPQSNMIVEFDDFAAGMNAATWVEDNDDVTQQGSITSGPYFQQSQAEYTDWNEESQRYENGKQTVIRQISDFLWYGLDAWGRNNPASEQPQCTATDDCFG